MSAVAALADELGQLEGAVDGALFRISQLEDEVALAAGAVVRVEAERDALVVACEFALRELRGATALAVRAVLDAVVARRGSDLDPRGSDDVQPPLSGNGDQKVAEHTFSTGKENGHAA